MKSKEDIKKMFDEMRENQPKFIEKNITEKPTEPGKYNIQIEGGKKFCSNVFRV